MPGRIHKTIERDRGWERIKRQTRRLTETVEKVGVIGTGSENKYDDDTLVTFVGAVHEFGYGEHDEKHFMSEPAEKGSGEVFDEAGEEYGRMVDGILAPEDVSERTGIVHRDQIQNQIKSIDLIDTRTLLTSISRETDAAGRY